MDAGNSENKSEDAVKQLDFEALEALVEVALEQMNRAHAPYSRFHVGAAVLGKSGKVYPGCNVENASYGLSLCAERNALARAVSEGEREFAGIVVATASSPPVPPCGLCRQALVEFSRDLPVLLVSTTGERVKTSLATLFPRAFTPADLAD